MTAFVSPPLAITGTVITAADINTAHTNHTHFNELVPTPTTWPLVLVAKGAADGDWDQVPTAAIADAAVTDAKLATPKVTKAGDTMTGTLTINATSSVAASGSITTSSSDANSITTQGGISANGLVAASGGFAGGSANITTTGQLQGGSAAITGASSVGGTSTVGASVVTNNESVGGTLAVTGTATVGAVSTAGTIVTTSASGSAINASNGGISAGGNLGVTGSGTFGSTVQGTRLIATQSTGTAPLTVSSTTMVNNLNAQLHNGALADTVPASGVIPIADSSGQIAAGFIPAGVGAPIVGELRLFGGSSMTVVNAAGWLLCDGSNVSRTTHSGLFAIVGTVFGTGDGSTTFGLPDLRDRFPIGKSGTKALGSVGGATTVNSEHTHNLSSASVTGSIGAAQGGTAYDEDDTGNGFNTRDASHTHSHSLDVGGTTDNGGSTTLSIQNPYQAFNFLIYSGVAT